jgi:hypothetical protein
VSALTSVVLPWSIWPAVPRVRGRSNALIRVEGGSGVGPGRGCGRNLLDGPGYILGNRFDLVFVEVASGGDCLETPAITEWGHGEAWIGSTTVALDAPARPSRPPGPPADPRPGGPPHHPASHRKRIRGVDHGERHRSSARARLHPEDEAVDLPSAQRLHGPEERRSGTPVSADRVTTGTGTSCPRPGPAGPQRGLQSRRVILSSRSARATGCLRKR